MLYSETVYISNCFDLSYNYRPVGDYEDYSPEYFIDYSDIYDETQPPEGTTLAYYETEEKARAAFTEIIRAAEEYTKSIHNVLYSFKDYLKIRRETK